MKEFAVGMVLGTVTGAVADILLHTKTCKKTTAGKAMQTVTDAVDSAAATVKNALDQ